MVLDCALEVGFFGLLGGTVIRAILVGGCTIFLRRERSKVCPKLLVPRFAGFQ